MRRESEKELLLRIGGYLALMLFVIVFVFLALGDGHCSSQMLPAASIQQGINGTRTRSVFLSQNHDARSGSIPSADVTHLLFHKSRHSMTRATVIRCRFPLLLKGIFHVVAVSSEKEMIRPNTSWIVATVADQQAIGDMPIVEFPGKAMRAYTAMLLAASSGKRHNSISVSPRLSFQRANPNPACCGFLHKLPEANDRINSPLGNCMEARYGAVQPLGQTMRSERALAI